jgi:predicted RNase H-like HicB family nuclease
MDIRHIEERHMIEYRGQSVSIGVTDTGEWVAVRSVTPAFLMMGDTPEEAEEKARHALDFWAVERFPR